MMKHVRSVVLWVSLTGVAAPLTNCADYIPADCDNLRSCGGAAGSTSGASSGGAGHPSGGSTGGLGAGGSTTTGGAGTAGAAGMGGAAPCDGACSGSTPVCDKASNTCVECTDKTQCAAPKPACDSVTNTCVECTPVDSSACKNGTPACDATKHECVECVGNIDCTNNAKALCDTTTEQCVACLQQSDCKDAAASKCDAGACKPCTMDAECSNIAGKGVCDSGTCVQCTIAKEAVCAGKSCNPTTKTCTTTPVGSVTTCKACLADSECVGGNQSDPDARCVPMNFMGVPRPGGFCLRRVAKTCSKPYQTPIMAQSLSRAATENYCGIAQDLTRCEAVLDLVNSVACSDGKDSSCGCVRDGTGNCAAPGTGGLCRLVGVNPNQCSYECGAAAQCPGGFSCAGVSTTYCQ